MSNATEDRITFKDFPEYTAAKQVWTYVPPVLIVVGTVANILAIVVLSRRDMQKSNTMFYLLVLAFADIVVLYSGLLRYWIRFVFEIDIRLLSDFSCKFHVFVVYVSLDFTSWILVAVALDRCVSASMPFSARNICKIRNAKIAVCAITVFLVFINGHLFWTIGIKFQADQLQCVGLYDFNMTIWPWIDFSVFCFIPFTTMIICNIILIRNLIISMRKMEKHCRPHRLRYDSNGTDYSDSINRAPPTASTKKGRTSSITVMLLSVNFLFLFLSAPIVIFLIGYESWYLYGSHHTRAKLEILWAVCNMMQYVNNTVHFFLYCLTGPQFRREFVDIFSSKNKVTNLDQQVTLTQY